MYNTPKFNTQGKLIMPKFLVEWRSQFDETKVRIPHLNKDWTIVPPEMMSFWNSASGKSNISQFILNELVGQFIKERKLITAPEPVILDTEDGDASLVIPKRDLFIRARLSNWFVETYPAYQIKDIASQYTKLVKRKAPENQRGYLSEEQVRDLFDVNKPLVLWNFSELCRAFNIKLFP